MDFLLFSVPESRGQQFKSFLPLASGALMSLAMHEAGHLASAELNGAEKFHLAKNGTAVVFKKQNLNDQKCFQISAGGFNFQQVGAETLLLEEKNDFTLGYLIFNFLHATFYQTFYRNQDQSYSDYKMMAEHSSLEAKDWQILVAAKTAIDLWRFYHPGKINLEPTLNNKEIIVRLRFEF